VIPGTSLLRLCARSCSGNQHGPTLLTLASVGLRADRQRSRRCARNAGDLPAGPAPHPGCEIGGRRVPCRSVDPEGYTLYAYGELQAWAQAGESVKSIDFDPVVAALQKGTFRTVLGNFHFNDKGT